MNTKNITLLDSFFPQQKLWGLAAIKNITFVVAFSLLLWISAKIQIPFYPVPITLQTMVVFLIGMVGGWKLGLATLLFYYLQALIGLPVLAGTPEKGIGLAYMIGPTGGYLLGFVVAILITGFFANKNIYKNYLPTIGVLLLANLSIYLLGASWLSIFIGAEKAIQFGVVPFLLGDIFKIAFAVLVIKSFFSLKKIKKG